VAFQKCHFFPQPNSHVRRYLVISTPAGVQLACSTTYQLLEETLPFYTIYQQSVILKGIIPYFFRKIFLSNINNQLQHIDVFMYFFSDGSAPLLKACLVSSGLTRDKVGS